MKWSVILQLAFQSIGIVYGDIDTTPLYVFSSTFPNGINHADDVLGVLSLILYTLTLIPLIKYVFIVLHANDNGDGGTFALYSLICRYANVGLVPSQQAEDSNVSNFQLELPGNKRSRMESSLKSKLENSRAAKFFLFFATLLGTSILIEDGVLTPCISVLSAVGGTKEATSAMTEDRVVWISAAILVCLFLFQRLGTDKVGYTFAPILLVWFAFIAGIGIYNIIHYDPTVIKALNPRYIVDYFRNNQQAAWISLGGIILCTYRGGSIIRRCWPLHSSVDTNKHLRVVYPALILDYTGQASFLRKHPDLVSDTFFKSVPGPVYWPMFVVAVLAAIIASQALISGTFSIIQQSLALGCFPHVKIVHTLSEYEGQVYVPEVNYLLMLACIGVTMGFRTTVKIFDQGGYLPLIFAVVLMPIMYVWNNVYRRKYFYEVEHKLSPRRIRDIAANTNICRIPGLALFYSELVQGIPPIFKHYVENVPALHSVLVFVSIKSLPISTVPADERFIFRRVEPKELNMYRCVGRYGYMDVRNQEEPFERILVENLKQFIRDDYKFSPQSQESAHDSDEDTIHGVQKEALERDIEAVDKAWEAGAVHLIGENEVVAAEGAGIRKRLMINYAFNFLKKNLRGSETVFDIPHKLMVKVGMTYEL